MWEEVEERLALLELIATGTLPFRARQEAAWRWLSELPWTRGGARRGQLLLVEAHRETVRRLLDRVWPEALAEAAELSRFGLPITPDGWRKLQDRRRGALHRVLPARLNRRTALALAGPHAKAALNAERRAALEGVRLTHDDLVRLRVPPGLRLRQEDRCVEADLLVGLLGELALPERAFLDGVALEGPIRALLTVENLGAWRDMALPEGWAAAHVPGWDTPSARLLLGLLHTVPALHFGDLDPAGVRIVRHLRSFRADVVWVVPAFWHEYQDRTAKPLRWPEDLDLEDAPPLVHELKARGRWMEQECIVLDGRLPGALEELLEQARGSASRTRHEGDGRCQ